MLTLQLCVCVVPLLLPLNLSFDTVESQQVSATELADSLHRLTSLKGADDDEDDDDDRPTSKDRKHGQESGDKEDANKHGERDGDRHTPRGHGQAHEKFRGKNPAGGPPRFGARGFHKPGFGKPGFGNGPGRHQAHPGRAFRGRRGAPRGFGMGSGMGFGFHGRGFSPKAPHAGPKPPFMAGPRPFHNTGSIADSFGPFHGPQNGHGFSAGPMSGLVFELLDLNGDGNLSRDEFQRLVAAVEKSHPRPPQHDGPQAHGPQAHGPQAHGPQAHGPQAHGPQAHGPQAHGPQAHGPQAHGPQMHGPQMHGMPGPGPDGRAEGPHDPHGFGPRPPMMHGFRPDFRPDHAGPRPEFRRPEMGRPEGHESKEPHRDPSARGPGPGREEVDRDKRDQDDFRDDARRNKNDDDDDDEEHHEDKEHGDKQSRDHKQSEKPLSNTRPNDLPHHVLPFDWI